MTRSWRAGLAVLLYAVAVVAMVAGAMSSWAPTSAYREEGSLLALVPVYAAFLAYATVGVLILVRQSENTMGWLLGAVGFFPLFGGGISDLYLQSGADWPLRDVAVWIGGWYFFAALATIPLIFLLFPDGHPASPHWRWVVRTVALALGALILRYMVGPGDCGSEDCGGSDNPFQPAALQPFVPTLEVVGTAGLLIGLLAGLVSLAWRFHRARGVERAQVKWFAAAALLALLLNVMQSVLALVLPEPDSLGNTMFAVALVLPAVAMAVAILRYRLYEIDRLISRTLAYTILTGLLLVVYLALVTTSSRLLPGDSSLSVGVSTLAVAALFQPGRRRIQDLVDRRFNRARYDADRTIEEFSARLRDEVDLDAVRADLIAVVQHTVEPVSTSLLLRNQVSSRGPAPGPTHSERHPMTGG